MFRALDSSITHSHNWLLLGVPLQAQFPLVPPTCLVQATKSLSPSCACWLEASLVQGERSAFSARANPLMLLCELLEPRKLTSKCVRHSRAFFFWRSFQLQRPDTFAATTQTTL